MKDKFFELGRQATIWCCENMDSDDYYWESHWERKYGELIVQEVLDILSTYRVKATFYDGVEYNCVHPITAIQNHFEVYK